MNKSSAMFLFIVLNALILFRCNNDQKQVTQKTPDKGTLDLKNEDQALSAKDVHPDDKNTINDKSSQTKPAQWDEAEKMMQKRSYHTSTLLEDGTVLVVGGLWSNPQTKKTEGLDTAERYDPKTGHWSSAGKMNSQHWQHEAVRLKDGRVLIVGGCAGAPSNTCMMGVDVEIYDPKASANPWKKASPMMNFRRGHRAVLLNDGRVFVAGGFDNQTNFTSVEIYDPQKDGWTSPPATLNEPRNLAAMVTLKNGKVFIAGGWSTQNFLNTVEIFDPANNSIKLLSSTLHEARDTATATLLQDGRVLIVGGWCDDDDPPVDCVVKNAELFDPATDKIVTVGSPGSHTVYHTATLLINGNVIVVGGTAKATSAMLFDTGTLTWSASAELSLGRVSHAATLLDDGRVIVSGGDDDMSKNSTDSVEIYTP